MSNAKDDEGVLASDTGYVYGAPMPRVRERVQMPTTPGELRPGPPSPIGPPSADAAAHSSDIATVIRCIWSGQNQDEAMMALKRIDSRVLAARQVPEPEPEHREAKRVHQAYYDIAVANARRAGIIR